MAKAPTFLAAACWMRKKEEKYKGDGQPHVVDREKARQVLKHIRQLRKQAKRAKVARVTGEPQAAAPSHSVSLDAPPNLSTDQHLAELYIMEAAQLEYPDAQVWRACDVVSTVACCRRCTVHR